MRTIKLLSWVLLGSLLAHFAPVAAAQATAAGGRVPGHVVAARVVGNVTATQTQTNLQLKVENNAILGQSYIITTGVGSSVILVFSNGASVNLGADSSLSIDEFVQEPLEKQVALADLEEEPSTSVTKLNLMRGELVGNVKKIHEDRGSSFTVNTPVGAAGIRGTTFRIVFRPAASGRVFFTLSTAEGRVLYEAPLSRALASVPTGQEISVAVDVQINQTTGTVAVVAPPVVSATYAIPAATQAAMAVVSQQIIQATGSIIIANTNQAALDLAGSEKAAAEKATQEKDAADKAAAEKAAAEKAEQDKGTKAQGQSGDKSGSDQKDGQGSSDASQNGSGEKSEGADQGSAGNGNSDQSGSTDLGSGVVSNQIGRSPLDQVRSQTTSGDGMRNGGSAVATDQD